MDRLGEKLRILRTRRNLTTRQLATMLDISFGHVAQIETGQKTPSAKLILKIAQLFNVSIDRLMMDNLELD